jgi:membrane associated rhomboid family serine protease
MSSFKDDLKFQYRLGGIDNKLIFWNIGFFLLSIIFFYQFKVGYFDYPNWLAVSSEPSIVLTKPWTLLTYAFLHYEFKHLLFNMIALYFSSRLFLTFFTQKQFIGVYMLSAIFCSLCFIIVFYIFGWQSMMVGASGAIMALLMAATTYQPSMDVRLLLIGHIKLWQITATILLLNFLVMFIDTGGFVAHVSGAFFGYIYIRLLQNGTDLSRIVNAVIDFFANLFGPKKATPFKKVHVNPKKPAVKRESKIVVKDKTQQQLDEILDKISQSGYDSLTAEEKEFLFKAGK